MSERTSSNGSADGPTPTETALEALQSSPAFSGPAEPLDGRGHGHANDHFALVYESREEQFAAAVPFVRQGLDRGERCLYVAAENSREDVLAAMRDRGVDVDAALESGQLSVHDGSETYLRDGTFDVDETLELVDAAVEEAGEEYTALRVTGEMSAVLQADPEGEKLLRCEARANHLFDETDGIALCQYDRTRFPADVLEDVISAHPLLVHDGRISHNVYYTPPEQFFDSGGSARAVDRRLEALREQTDAKLELRRRERFLRESYEITSDPGRSFEEKLQALFDLGCEMFDLAFGFLNRVDPDADRLQVEYASDDHEHYEVGSELPLSETYCRAAVDVQAATTVTNPDESGFEDCLVYQEFGVEGYLGTYIPIEGGVDRTLAFVPAESGSVSVSGADRTYLELMGQWIGYELDRRRRERELRERTEHLDALVETTPECIKTVAPDGTLLQMNPAGLEMVEADAAPEVIGESVYDLIAPADRERFRRFNERICGGERGTLEFDVVGLDGTRRHMESHAVPLSRPDGSTAHLALTRDVTDQIERERELERALDLLEKTERIADVGGWEIDPETEEVFWTDHIFDLLEVDADEEPPLAEALEMYHEDDRPVVEGAVEDALATGDAFDEEVRIWTDADEVRWLRLQGVPEVQDGEVVSFRGAAQDVTERKRREQRLERVIDRLQASNERLEQFAYAASHDLQEPLRMVSSYLQLIESRYAEKLDAEGEEYLAFAVDGADRMREMIEALLEYSRVETQGDPLEPVDLEAAVDDVLSDLRLQIEESDAEITVGDLPTVAGDASQLRQVFQNLLENAITYSGEAPPRIDVSAERAGSEWVVTVSDEGIGIPPDAQERIFEVFQRLHTHGEYEGTGIGLALCERIVERHGGEIEVASEPGDGTTFSFTLPTAGRTDR